MICLTPKLDQSFIVYCIQNKETMRKKKSFLRKKSVEKEGIITALVTGIKKDPHNINKKAR